MACLVLAIRAMLFTETHIARLTGTKSISVAMAFYGLGPLIVLVVN